MCNCDHKKSAATIYTPRSATIKKVEQLTATEKLFEIAFDDGGQLGHQPGQFVEVSVFGIGEAPISITSSPSRSNGSFRLGIRNAGSLTNAIHNLQPGAKLGIRGPFGTNFPVADLKGKDLLFVAGGIGLLPLRSAINQVLDNRQDYGRVIILFGAKSPAERVMAEELEEWRKREDVEFLDTVDKGDDSWTGNVGVITTLFPKIEIDPATTYCLVAGPPIMYRYVILSAKEKGLTHDHIIVSLERRMKCGVGKCGHCQINGKYVCEDGPVFYYSDIETLEEAL